MNEQLREEFIKSWHDAGGGWTMGEVSDFWLSKLSAHDTALVEGIKRFKTIDEKKPIDVFTNSVLDIAITYIENNKIK